MTAPTGEFSDLYRHAFEAYVEQPSEGPLSAAYELGRSAVRNGLSVLDLATAHHQALIATLETGSNGSRPRAVADAAGEFFLEAVSAFEIVQRVLQEARESALVERRQATLLRRLSTFLADASIALDTATSLEEMLQLVAEHAREMTGAARCNVRLSLDGDERRSVTAYADDDPSARQQDAGSANDLDALFAAIRPPSGSVRMTGAELARHPAPRALDRSAGVPVRGWLAASLTALDGSDLGIIQLYDKEGGDFSELDEAVIVQLAQMAAAAVERAQLYRR